MMYICGKKDNIGHITELEYLIKHYSINNCISINDSMETYPRYINKHCKNILPLIFKDELKETEPDAPKKIHVEKAIEFYKSIGNQDVIIHCNYGIARSTAIGLGLLYMDLKDEYKACDQLYQIRSKAQPNRILLSIFDEIFGSKLNSHDVFMYLVRKRIPRF